MKLFEILNTMKKKCSNIKFVKINFFHRKTILLLDKIYRYELKKMKA